MICVKCGKEVKRIDKDDLCIACAFERILNDPKIAAEAKHFKRVSTPSYDQLNRPFTR